MLTMRPERRSTICRPKTWQVRKVPVKLVSIREAQSFSGKSRVGARWLYPAELTRMSTFPNVLTIDSSKRSREARSVTSEVIDNDRRPKASISPAAILTCSCRRAVGTTSAPAWASPSAIARPIPEVPPTTTATLPLRSKPL